MIEVLPLSVAAPIRSPQGDSLPVQGYALAAQGDTRPLQGDARPPQGDTFAHKATILPLDCVTSVTSPGMAGATSPLPMPPL